jgi:hypothetical protein
MVVVGVLFEKVFGRKKSWFGKKKVKGLGILT